MMTYDEDECDDVPTSIDHVHLPADVVQAYGHEED